MNPRFVKVLSIAENLFFGIILLLLLISLYGTIRRKMDRPCPQVDAKAQTKGERDVQP
jgi:hypothetical protein